MANSFDQPKTAAMTAISTGNFIVNILRRPNRRDLKRKYREELLANEIVLLPYYIASLNAECFEYRLGNRSALEWVIGQYQVGADKRSGITGDPNRADDEEYIVRLIGRVVTVNLETVRLVKGLPAVVEEIIDQ